MKKIMLSLGVITIVAVGAIGATRAYFTNTETSTGNTFTAGTLDLQIANAGAAYSNGVSSTWSSPANWAPGQEVNKSIYLKNTGSIPAAVVYANWTNFGGDAGMANYIQVTKISDSTNGDSTETFRTYYDQVANGGNNDGVLSLAELINGKTSATTPAPFKAKFYADADGLYHNPVLPAGGEFRIDLAYKFMASAPDTLQGKQASFDLVLQAAQLPFSGTIQY